MNPTLRNTLRWTGITLGALVLVMVLALTFLDWNLNAQIAETQFTHVPPTDFRRIKIIGRVPLEDSATEQDSKTQTQTQEN